MFRALRRLVLCLCLCLCMCVCFIGVCSRSVCVCVCLYVCVFKSVCLPRWLPWRTWSRTASSLSSSRLPGTATPRTAALAPRPLLLVLSSLRARPVRPGCKATQKRQTSQANAPSVQCGAKFSVKSSLGSPCGPPAMMPRPTTTSITLTMPRCFCSVTPLLRQCCCLDCL